MFPTVMYLQSDLTLLEKIRAGDTLAEEELISRYKDKVSLCTRKFYLFGGDNEDLIQEGMIGLLSAIRTFNDDCGASFATYAERCIVNRLNDAVSLKKYSGFISLDDDSVSCLSTVDDPEALFVENECFEKLKANVSVILSSYEKSVLNLYLSGSSYKEISVSLDKSVVSVYNAVQRIREKLSAYYSGDTVE